MQASTGTAKRCARPGCGGASIATLTYHYASRTVWLDGAGVNTDAGWGLCATHAETLKVPVGWQLDDRRAAYTRPDAGVRPLAAPPAIAV